MGTIRTDLGSDYAFKIMKQLCMVHEYQLTCCKHVLRLSFDDWLGSYIMKEFEPDPDIVL